MKTSDLHFCKSYNLATFAVSLRVQTYRYTSSSVTLTVWVATMRAARKEAAITRLGQDIHDQLSEVTINLLEIPLINATPIRDRHCRRRLAQICSRPRTITFGSDVRAT